MKTNNKPARRDFIKLVGLGAISASSGLGMGFVSNTNEHQITKDHESLNNGFSFETLFQDNFFLGIGKVSFKGLSLRSGRLPLSVHISSPEGIEITNLRVFKKTIDQDKIVFDFSVQKKMTDLQEWMLHTVRNRRNLSDWTSEPADAADTKLSLIIKPLIRKIGDLEVIGFSYQYIYNSQNIPIYKITDRSSWEINGSSIGNELWMRNGVVDSITEFKNLKDFYSTEWYLPGIANPNIFQFHPLQTHLQGFTFTSSSEGTLISFPSKIAHIRSLFEKRKGSDEILHFHEHCNDLSAGFETVPMEILWIPGASDRVGRYNLYNQIREMVHEELHSQIGMKRERISTYGVIEEQTEPDFDNYRFNCLPALLDAGAKTIFIPSQCQNDMNTWGVSNMCCNVDFKISDSVGEEKLKSFCQVARERGAQIEMWGNTAISTLTERFMHHDGKPKGIQFLPYKGSIMEVIRNAESPFVRNASNAIEADHYTPRFCALNLRDKDIRKYWMKQWKFFHDEIGIQGIFLDSSFNMSSDKFHHAQFDETNGWGGATLDQKELLGKYRPENEPPKLIHTQYHAHLSWVVEMQKMGYRYCAEDMGVFGINRTGPDLSYRLSSLPIWADSFCKFNEEAVKKAGFIPIDIFFRGLAYRMMWMMIWNFRKDKLELGTENPDAFKLIKVFNEVTDWMYNREILSEENAVLYSHNGIQILWVFNDFEYFTPSKLYAENLIDGQKWSGELINAKKNNVYRISTKNEPSIM